jgi:hypothetical protein
MRKALITVTSQGNILTATEKTPRAQRGARKQAAKRKPRPRGKAPYGERHTGDLARAVRRSKVALAQTVGAIRNRPSSHISVILPKRVEVDFELAVLNDCLKKFFNQITRLHPGCYFVRFYGWTPEAGLHAHILMRFGDKSPRHLKEREVRNAWSGIVGSYAPKLVEMTKFREGGSIGYLTAPKVDKELRVVIQRLNGGRVWSVINRKNIRWHEKFVLRLTPAEHEAFKSILRELFKKYALEESNSAQVRKSSYCLNYLPPALLKEAIKKFRKGRERHGA